jgi:phosphoserine phosphatase
MRPLQRGRWTPLVYDALVDIVESAQPGDVAAFDFDGTVCCWDVSEAAVAEGVRREVFTDADVLDLVCPPAGGVHWRDGLVRYYEALSACDTRRGTHFGHYPGSLWTAQVFAGHALATYLDCVDGGIAHHLGPRPIPEVVDLMDALAERGVAVYVVTAGIAWAVRRAVKALVNPHMQRTGGLPLDRVLGITALLADPHSGALLTDDAAIALYGQDYLRGAPPCDDLLITALTGGGLSFAGGKVAALIDRLDRAALHLAVGDGGGDVALMTLARHGLWLADDAAPTSAALRPRMEVLGVLVQPVRGGGELIA